MSILSRHWVKLWQNKWKEIMLDTMDYKEELGQKGKEEAGEKHKKKVGKEVEEEVEGTNE